MCTDLKWEMMFILPFHWLEIALDRPSAENKHFRYTCTENIIETYKLTCMWTQHMHRQTQKPHTNTHARSPMLIFIPRALILLCMSASSGTPTENPSMCASVCVRSWRWENNVAPEGSHLSPFSPSSLIPPLDSVPAGISLFSSGEMSDLFHHPSHRGWTLPSVHPTSVKLQNQSHFCISRPSGA